MLKTAIPELHVSSAVAAKSFYATRLGFTCEHSWKPDDRLDDPCYMIFARDGARLHVSSFKDGVLGGSVYVYVDDVDALHAEFAARGVHPLGDVADQAWGTREFGVTDPDGNKIRFGQSRSGRQPR